MAAGLNRGALWQATALLGVCLIALAIVPAYVEEASNFTFGLFSKHYAIFFLLLLIGVVISFFGLVGWAKQLRRDAQMRMAAFVFISPWIAALVGYPIAGINVHGPGALVMILIIPASVLALVLLIMADSARPSGDPSP